VRSKAEYSGRRLHSSLKRRKRCIKHQEHAEQRIGSKDKTSEGKRDSLACVKEVARDIIVRMILGSMQAGAEFCDWPRKYSRASAPR